MRSATAASVAWRAPAVGLGLGLAILGMAIGLAHAGTRQPAAPAQVAEALVPPLPDNSFVLRTQPASQTNFN